MERAASKPLVSIIVPIYNVEKFLDDCVESIVKQSYDNLDIILVDDGSPDNSPKICDEWAKKDNRIKVIHKKNGGVCSARNEGIKSAKGEWISFVDADDFIEETYVEDMYNKAIETNSKYVCCGYNKVYSNNVESINADGEVKELQKKDYLISLLNVQTSYGFVHMKLINKELFKNVKFNENLVVGEDALFNIELTKNIDKAVIMNKPLYNYRINLDSVVRRYDTNYVKKYTDSMETMTKYINDNYANDETIKTNLSNYIVYHLMLICVNYCYNPKNENKYKSLKEVCNMDIYKKAIKNSNYNNLSLSRKVTLFTIKSKLYFLTALLCKIRQSQIRK